MKLWERPWEKGSLSSKGIQGLEMEILLILYRIIPQQLSPLHEGPRSKGPMGGGEAMTSPQRAASPISFPLCD